MVLSPVFFLTLPTIEAKRRPEAKMPCHIILIKNKIPPNPISHPIIGRLYAQSITLKIHFVSRFLAIVGINRATMYNTNPPIINNPSYLSISTAS